MTALQWSIILGALGLCGLWLIGNKRRTGFIISIIADTLWLIYSVQTAQWGFTPECVIFMAVHLRNYRRWAPA